VTDESPRLSARPEAPWALWSGVASGIVATGLSAKAILGSGSSTAAVGFIFVPFIAIAAMVAGGIWGLAAGCVWLALRGAQRYAPGLLAAAAVFALAVPAGIGWECWRGLALQEAVRAVRVMTAGELDEAFRQSRWSDDRFFLGTIVQNPVASGALLDRIAALPDEALYESMGSLWDVMGENRKGIAVMRLLALHPNARGDTLGRLADGPHGEKLRHELARSPATPLPVLARYFDSTDYLVEWGLALNPNAPPAVMERLARSANQYTRLNLTYNPAAPRALLERLAQDPDRFLAQRARSALEQRAKREN
jgi:hypothetical protein